MEVRLNVLPKQHQFLESPAREVMYSGAVRAGKTFCLGLKTYRRASVRKAREILCRKTLKALKATTLRTLLEGDGVQPPIIPYGSYTHNKVDQIIRLHNGGEIVYFGIDHPEAIGSYSGTGFNCDEATELTKSDYRMGTARASLTVPGVQQQINLACNPGPPSHFLAVRFGIAPKSKAMPSTHAIMTRTNDNQFLSPEYLAYLDERQGTLWHRRYVLGMWCGSDGLVYDRWDRDTHVRERKGPWARIVLGVDDGYTNPFVCLRIGIDGDGRAHVISEHYERQLLIGDRLRRIREMSEGVDAVLYDPSAADLGAEVLQSGLPTVENEEIGPRSVRAGIDMVQARLAVQGDGYPRLTVDPACENTIAEFETYEWKPVTGGDGLKDEPIKASDHAMDALRYGIRYIDNATPLTLAGDYGKKPPPSAVDMLAVANAAPARSYDEMRQDVNFGFEESGRW